MLLKSKQIFLSLQVVNLFIQTQCTCVLLQNCPAAVKLTKSYKRNHPDSINLLFNAHCGFDSDTKLPKINCDQIPTEDAEETVDCVGITDCPAAAAILNSGQYDPQIVDKLRDAVCDKDRHMVRCKEFAKSLTMKSRINEDYKDLLPAPGACGSQGTIQNIYNGKIADLEDFPWLARVNYKNISSKKASFKCHASLISKRYLVTAAHCIPQNANEKIYSVVLGEFDTRNETDCVYNNFDRPIDCADPIREILVEKVVRHPNFSSEGYNDVGIIRLKEEVEFTDFIKPICLPVDPLNLKPSEGFYITGWGRTEKGVESDVKLKALIFLLDQSECKYSYRGIVLKNQICAGAPSNGADFCNGDSGGPLIAYQRTNGDQKAFLAGIVSFNNRCGRGASVFSDVQKFSSWILENLEK